MAAAKKSPDRSELDEAIAELRELVDRESGVTRVEYAIWLAEVHALAGDADSAREMLDVAEAERAKYAPHLDHIRGLLYGRARVLAILAR